MMPTDLLETIAAYCETPGPSGHEERVRALTVERWTALGLDVRVDPVGNVLARVGGEGPRVLLQAHLDEIGFTVRHITDDGFLRLGAAQGSVHDAQTRRYMVGQPARVVGREAIVEGIFAAPSGHVLTREHLEQPDLFLEHFFVDLGLRSRAEAEQAGVHLGAGVIWHTPTRRLGHRLVGKAMDDRLLLAVLEHVVRALDGAEPSVKLWLAATIQEENGCHGATALAARERFDEAVALEIGLTGDVPLVGREAVEGRLGDGPVIVHQDQIIAYTKAVSWRLADAAQRAGVPVQHGAFGNYGSDGAAFIRAGIPTALVATPVRYTHTAFEMADPQDVLGTVELLRALVTTPR